MAHAAGAGSSSDGTAIVWVGLLAAALAVIAAFLPWISTPLASVSGIDGGGDGLVVLLLGLIPIAAFIAMATSKKTSRGRGVTILIPSLVQLLIYIVDYADIAERVEGTNGIAKIGAGIYLGLLASLVAAMIGLIVTIRGAGR